MEIWVETRPGHSLLALSVFTDEAFVLIVLLSDVGACPVIVGTPIPVIRRVGADFHVLEVRLDIVEARGFIPFFAFFLAFLIVLFPANRLAVLGVGFPVLLNRIAEALDAADLKEDRGLRGDGLGLQDVGAPFETLQRFLVGNTLIEANNHVALGVAVRDRTDPLSEHAHRIPKTSGLTNGDRDVLMRRKSRSRCSDRRGRAEQRSRDHQTRDHCGAT